MFDYKEALLHAPDRILNIVLTYIPLSPHQSSSIFKRSKHLSGETWNKMINQVPLKDIVQAHQAKYSPALGLGSLAPSTGSILLNPEIAKAKAEGEALMLKKQIQCDLDLAEEKTIKGSTKKM